MHLKLVAIGKQMSSWVTSGFAEYNKRLPSPFKLELIEIPAGKRTKGSDLKRLIQQEGKAMLDAINPEDYVVALAVDGKPWSTEILSAKLRSWYEENQSLCFLVGGPEGLDEACLKRANAAWSLSALTLPHPLVRIILAEQIYRAWSILQGHPYHR